MYISDNIELDCRIFYYGVHSIVTGSDFHICARLVDIIQHCFQ